MKRSYLQSFMMSSFLLLACQQNPNESTSVSIKSEKPVQTENTCLINFSEDYSKLLTKDMAAEITGFPANQAIVGTYLNGTDRKEYDYIQYEWKNGREKYIAQIERMAKTNDYVKVTGIKEMSLIEFEMSYRAVSDSEMKELENVIDQKSSSKDPVIPPAQKEKLEKLGISEEKQKEMMKDFAGMAQKVTQSYSPVDGIGDAAVWNTKENTLYVLTNGAKFQVTAEVSGDEAPNKKVAISTAKMIVDRCK